MSQIAGHIHKKEGGGGFGSIFAGAVVRIQFALRTAPSHVSIPQNQNGTMAKDGLMRQENV